MSLRNAIQRDPTFGLARALKKDKSNDTNDVARGKSSPPKDRRRVSVSAADFRENQNKLKTKTAVRQDGLEIWPLPGLAPMTRVRTSFGDVHAIALRKGDDVLTSTGEFLPILWLNRINLDEHILAKKPDSNPIVIATSALGSAAPGREIMVSPRQIIAADDRSGLRSSREAAMLISRPGVRRLQETGLSYTMFHVGKPADVFCEGLYLQFPLET